MRKNRKFKHTKHLFNGSFDGWLRQWKCCLRNFDQKRKKNIYTRFFFSANAASVFDLDFYWNRNRRSSQKYVFNRNHFTMSMSLIESHFHEMRNLIIDINRNSWNSMKYKTNVGYYFSSVQCSWFITKKKNFDRYFRFLIILFDWLLWDRRYWYEMVYVLMQN